jgi:putative membrane protein
MMGIGMLGGMFLFWGLLIVLAVLLVRGLFTSGRPSHEDSAAQQLSPRQILDQRYARGEITQAQYQLMLQDLK